jgi:hypothetical protein
VNVKDDKMKESVVRFRVCSRSEELKETTQTSSINYCLDQLITVLNSVPKVCVCDDDDDDDDEEEEEEDE